MYVTYYISGFIFIPKTNFVLLQLMSKVSRCLLRQGDVIAASQYLKKACKKAGEELYQEV